MNYLHSQLQQLPGIELLSRPRGNVGIATFVPSANADVGAVDMAHWLDNRDIAVRVGRHCAMPLMDSLSPIAPACGCRLPVITIAVR